MRRDCFVPRNDASFNFLNPLLWRGLGEALPPSVEQLRVKTGKTMLALCVMAGIAGLLQKRTGYELERKRGKSPQPRFCLICSAGLVRQRTISTDLIFCFFCIKTKELGLSGYELYHKTSNTICIVRSVQSGIASFLTMTRGERTEIMNGNEIVTPSLKTANLKTTKKAIRKTNGLLISDLPVLSHLDLNFNTAWQFKLH
jgi:hypothetical protein